jgi:hypothetical protein
MLPGSWTYRQKIIGSNELLLIAIEVTRFHENKRSNEVTKMATVLAHAGAFGEPIYSRRVTGRRPER